MGARPARFARVHRTSARLPAGITRHLIRWRALRILMLTAKGRDTEVEKGLGLGADAYVTKPFSTKDLVVQIRMLLGAPR